MTLVTRLILLSIFLCLVLLSAPVVADGEADEIATPAEIAHVNSLLEQLDGEMEAQLQIRVDTLIDGLMERELAMRIAKLGQAGTARCATHPSVGPCG